MSATFSISALDQLKGLIVVAQTISEEDRERYLAALEAEDIPDALRLELADVMDREADFHAAAKQEVLQQIQDQNAERSNAVADAQPQEESAMAQYVQENESVLQNFENDLTKLELDGEKAIETEARGDEAGQMDALRGFLKGSSNS